MEGISKLSQLKKGFLLKPSCKCALLSSRFAPKLSFSSPLLTSEE
jgi:hypothetical protein